MLSNEQYSRVMREYEKRRLEARSVLEARRQEIREKLPEYRALDEQRLELTMERARRLILSDGAGAADAQTLSRLSERKQAALLSAGYPADYLELPVSCPLCRDTGLVNGEKCSCFKATAMNVLYHDSPLWDRAEAESFDRADLSLFDPEPLEALGGLSPRENMRRLLAFGQSYVANFERQRDSLLLMGPVGTGKTYLCNAIAGALLKEGFAVLYLTAAEYFDKIAEIAFGNSGTGSFEELMAGTDLLLIDDLGMEQPSSLVQSSLFRTVNERLLKGQATVISTNLSLNDIKNNYNERVASRMLGGYRTLRFGGGDIRVAKRRLRT